MMKKLLLVALAGSTMLAASIVAVRAQDGPGPEGRRGQRFDVARMQSELGLSDDQVAQLEKMRSDNRSQAIRQRADLRIAQGELNDLLRGAAVDDKAVSAKLKQVTDLQAAATRARVEHRLALRRVLTPEQFTKMQSLVGPHRGDGPRRRGFRGPRSGGEPGGGPAPGSDQ
jgi:Spy/CpxP family protein refolding chaperone